MKKGISLIVLVITIIVMIIIAGAIILSLNSSNVTNKAKWAQISSDRANFQNEYITILADELGQTKAEDDYEALTYTAVQGNDLYADWKARVLAAGFTLSEPENTNPAGLKVTKSLTTTQAEAYGILNDSKAVVNDYSSWVTLSDATTPAPEPEG